MSARNKLKKNHFGKLSGYKSSVRNRNSTLIASGGVAVYVKNDCFIQEIPLQTALEAIAVKVKINTLITVCNIYIPNSQNFDTYDLDNILMQLPKPYVIVGDFNSHSKLWGSTKLDRRGKVVKNGVDNHSTYLIKHWLTYTFLMQVMVQIVQLI